MPLWQCWSVHHSDADLNRCFYKDNGRAELLTNNLKTKKLIYQLNVIHIYTYNNRTLKYI